MIVWGKVHNDILHGMQGICTNHNYLFKLGVLTAKAVVSVNKDKLVPVKLFNSTSEIVDIPRGQIVAKFEILDNDSDLIATCIGNKDNPEFNNVQFSTEKCEDGELSGTKFFSYFDIPKHLSESEQGQLKGFLKSHDNIFVTDENPALGFTDVVQHKIILKPDFKPKYQRSYRLTPDKKQVLRDHLDHLLKQGIISPVGETEHIPITSPIVLVSKRANESRNSQNSNFNQSSNSLSQFRFCCDFRYLNSQSQQFFYGLPELQDLTESFSNRTPNFITHIDLSSGFFQMPISPDSQRYTAFNTCYGTYQFLRLPMGLSSSPGSFQLLMDKVLHGLTFNSCLCYLDDVLITSETFEQHLSDLHEVFNRLKTVYNHRLIELQQFKNIRHPDHAEIEPLTKLLRKNAKFRWTSEQENAFTKLKSLLINSPILAFPNFHTEFYLAVDTSSKGIGYMLYQYQETASDSKAVSVIRFGSKSLSKWQRSYGPTKLELLGMDTEISTEKEDHSNFTTLNTDGDETQTSLSTETATSENNTQVKFTDSVEIFRHGDFIKDTFQKLQVRDPYFGPFISYFEQNKLPSSQKAARKLLLETPNYDMVDGLLFHTRTAKCKRTKLFTSYQLALPEVAIKTVLRLYHDSPLSGHGGIQHTADMLKEHYYFPKLLQSVTDYVRSCHDCQSRKVTQVKTKAGIVAFKTPEAPFQVWQMDLYGPVPVSAKGNSYIFTAVDAFTKFLVAEPIPNKDALTVAEVLFKLVSQYGVCDTLISDRGSEATARAIKEVCRLLEINQQYTRVLLTTVLVCVKEHIERLQNA
ncbi:unnamed protein product [Mytilus coruscus]|uniref:Integrase catalytic domain-containing protein n=1 Tax=Mytilus coruscus TaxID=42192 RepID=A0A6J8CGN3_MYTCO|nr:unnamed protein product [Mytilus coruscus]